MDESEKLFSSTLIKTRMGSKITLPSSIEENIKFYSKIFSNKLFRTNLHLVEVDELFGDPVLSNIKKCYSLNILSGDLFRVDEELEVKIIRKNFIKREKYFSNLRDAIISILVDWRVRNEIFEKYEINGKYSDGKIECSYLNGLLDGKFIRKDENKIVSTNFSNGLVSDKIKVEEYDISITKREIDVVSNSIDGIYRFIRNGKERIALFDKGKFIDGDPQLLLEDKDVFNILFG